MRPVLRYHGGKWLLADWIIAHLPPHRVYVEPFGGAASVLLRKQRSYAEVYNDLDGEIVSVFRVLRNKDQAAELERQIRFTPFARVEFVDSYEPHDSPIEQARRTILRSFMGFGSPAASGHSTGFRSNSNRSGTTPAHDWANLPDSIAEWTDRMRGVVIENKDAADLLRQHDGPETLFYVDPPYVLSTRQLNAGKPGKGYRFEMTDEQHRVLADALHSLNGMVVLSGYPCDLYDELFGDWQSVSRKALADGARKRVECLWFNPRAAASQTQGKLEMQEVQA